MTTRPRLDPARYAVEFLLDLIRDAQPAHWHRRAQDFQWVITGDRRRTPTPDELAARPDLAETIQACRNKALLLERDRHLDDEDLLRGIAYDVLEGRDVA